jgi:hypothetical protein
MFQAMALGARQRTVVTLRTRLNLILKRDGRFLVDRNKSQNEKGCKEWITGVTQ